MVLAAKRGQAKNVSSKVKKVAHSISESDASDFARKKVTRKNVSRSLAKRY